LQRGQPWHILAMNGSRIGEIALLKLRGLLLEMRLDQRNLLAIRGVFDRDSLPAAIRQGLEQVHGLFEVEGHDLGPPLGDILLPGLRAADPDAGQETTQGERDERHVTGDTWQALLRLLRITVLPKHLASPF
jgi:hypothetical protein